MPRARPPDSDTDTGSLSGESEEVGVRVAGCVTTKKNCTCIVFLTTCLIASAFALGAAMAHQPPGIITPKADEEGQGSQKKSTAGNMPTKAVVAVVPAKTGPPVAVETPEPTVPQTVTLESTTTSSAESLLVSSSPIPTPALMPHTVSPESTTTSGPESTTTSSPIPTLPFVPQPISPDLLCLTDGMQNPVFYHAGLATTYCHVTGIPCEINSTGVAYIAHDSEAGILNAHITFQDVNVARTPIIALHLHRGDDTVNGGQIAYFCGEPPMPAMHGLPACSQESSHTYRGYFLHEDGTYSTVPSNEFKDYLLENKVTPHNIHRYVYYNLHTSYSWIKTHGKGLIRAQLIASGKPPIFATAGCTPEIAEIAVPETPCSDALPGSNCFKDVIWALAHGIHQHPDWYTGLSAYSDIYDFQAYLHKTKQGSGECPEPCHHRRLRGI